MYYLNMIERFNLNPYIVPHTRHSRPNIMRERESYSAQDSYQKP
ncbi:MAG: hypothetical protein ACJA1M_001630, partial [Alphaproteobacteria bacterium]